MRVTLTMGDESSSQYEARLRVAVVGHVDHGKSTLVGRLLADTGRVRDDVTELAHSTDHLVEERDGALTLDTAQAFMRLGGRDLVLVDVPGHRELLRNMMTGATRADAAVLVVAADEGLRDQTRRHAFLLSMLGIGEVIVAVNKIDAVCYSSDRFDEVRGEVTDLLARLGIEPPAIVPVSAARGCNVSAPAADTSWYLGPTLLDALSEIRAPEGRELPARFIVQGVYDADGTSTCAGRVVGGTIGPGDELICHPAGTRATVERIVRFPEDDAPARPGESVALSLRGATPARGSVLSIAAGEPPAVSDRVNGRVFWWHRRPLRMGDRATLRCATQDVRCVVTQITRVIDTAALNPAPDAGSIRDTDASDVVLTTDRAIVTESFSRYPALGRFVLEYDGKVAGAGIVP